jgi:hypothetical protein
MHHISDVKNEANHLEFHAAIYYKFLYASTHTFECLMLTLQKIIPPKAPIIPIAYSFFALLLSVSSTPLLMKYARSKNLRTSSINLE